MVSLEGSPQDELPVAAVLHCVEWWAVRLAAGTGRADWSALEVHFTSRKAYDAQP
jgi:hypothetical protein